MKEQLREFFKWHGGAAFDKECLVYCHGNDIMPLVEELVAEGFLKYFNGCYIQTKYFDATTWIDGEPYVVVRG